MKTLLDSKQLDITLQRLAHELIENHLDFTETAIIGLQPRGVWLSDRVVSFLEAITKKKEITYGKLDITFYRDDVHQEGGLLVPSQTDINFSIENKNVILIDDVLHTGRTVRAAMDALLDFGRPKNVELLVLIDRHYSRELPIQADYIGMVVDTIISQKVKVNWKDKDKKDEVLLIG
ncbi:MAG TPA: bifunctional pyr operon transcriptional regulator/uracil phosphoribosyltransferase PyrR [Flavipsychrobacter sp.]|nr:bifunctional pyr operon transcriptional regulator/uracil phosphoribosyltransferase PyrR [Flavipsychrobacter sp.]